jgi:hypothetical protein
LKPRRDARGPNPLSLPGWGGCNIGGDAEEGRRSDDGERRRVISTRATTHEDAEDAR